jgi:hypothetical protein
MTRWFAWTVLLTLLLASAAGDATPLHFDLGSFAPPAAPENAGRPRGCTITYLVEDDAANETFAARMMFTPATNAAAQNGRIPCPTLIPPRVAEAALDGCREHAANKGDCVFADMSRGFETAPGIPNTAENASRCASDQASQIAIACWRSGNLDLCNVGCGSTPQAAIATARDRCQLKHEKQCTITGALPVEAPQ